MTDDTRPADITTEARRLAEAATPGPWRSYHDEEGETYIYAARNRYVGQATQGTQGIADAAFIAWCRTGVPALLEWIAELEATNAKLAAFAGTVPSKGDVR